MPKTTTHQIDTSNPAELRAAIARIQDILYDYPDTHPQQQAITNQINELQNNLNVLTHNNTLLTVN